MISVLPSKSPMLFNASALFASQPSQGAKGKASTKPNAQASARDMFAPMVKPRSEDLTARVSAFRTAATDRAKPDHPPSRMDSSAKRTDKPDTPRARPAADTDRPSIKEKDEAPLAKSAEDKTVDNADKSEQATPSEEQSASSQDKSDDEAQADKEETSIASGAEATKANVSEQAAAVAASALQTPSDQQPLVAQVQSEATPAEAKETGETTLQITGPDKPSTAPAKENAAPLQQTLNTAQPQGPDAQTQDTDAKDFASLVEKNGKESAKTAHNETAEISAPQAQSQQSATPASQPKPPETVLQSLQSSLQTGNAATNTSPTTQPQTEQRFVLIRDVPIQAVPIEIGMRAMNGTRSFDIRLDPADLGRIDVKLDVDDQGNVSAKLVVDRVETLALLQRDARTLERAFEQAGLKPQEGGIDMSLRDQSLFQNGRGQDGQPNGGSSRSGSQRHDDGQSSATLETDIRPPRRLWNGLSGLDLRI